MPDPRAGRFLLLLLCWMVLMSACSTESDSLVSPLKANPESGHSASPRIDRYHTRSGQSTANTDGTSPGDTRVSHYTCLSNNSCEQHASARDRRTTTRTSRDHRDNPPTRADERKVLTSREPWGWCW